MVPPVADRDWLKAVPKVPAVNEVVVIESGAGLIVIESALVAVLATESVTFTVKLEVPAVVGVPEITPAELSVRPAGRVPDEIDHE